MVTKKEYRRRVADVLQTEDAEEQLEAIEILAAQARSAVVDLVVRFDGRFGAVNVTTVGSGQGKLTVEQALDILEEGKRFLLQIERESLQKVAVQEAQKGPEPQEGPGEIVQSPVDSTV